MAYAAYLRNTTPGHSKHYFIMVVQVGDQWCVRKAWGRIGNIQADKTDDGPVHGGKFTSERGAEGYCRKTVTGKCSEGYTLVWSTDSAVPCTTQLIGKVEPAWWPHTGAPVSVRQPPEKTMAKPAPLGPEEIDFLKRYGREPARMAYCARVGSTHEVADLACDVAIAHEPIVPPTITFRELPPDVQDYIDRFTSGDAWSKAKRDSAAKAPAKEPEKPKRYIPKPPYTLVPVDKDEDEEK